MSVGRLAATALRPLGLGLVRLDEARRSALLDALARARSAGLRIRTAIDVGAAFGDWSVECRRLFPDARLLLVEPTSEFAPFLRARVAELGGATWVQAAATSEPGSVTLHVHDDLVGSSTRVEPEPGLEAARRTVEGVTVDDLVAEHGLEPPFLLKADVQGAEFDVVAGAEATLAQTELVVLEALLFEFYEGAALLGDLVSEMRRRGFAVYDLCDLAYRPLDDALAQVDVLFTPAGSVLRRDRRYAAADQRLTRTGALRELFERRLAELERRTP